MFHKDIKSEEKEKLNIIIEIIKNNMNQRGYESVRYIQKRVLKSIVGESINKVRMYFQKNNTKYANINTNL